PLHLTLALFEHVNLVYGTISEFCTTSGCPDMIGPGSRKARRKDTPDQKDTKLYLEESVLERKLPDADLRVLVDIPAGLDYNEWLASHNVASWLGTQSFRRRHWISSQIRTIINQCLTVSN
uniref:CSON005298 protein n=1 Tax=Culicoides sonorensis TaxID=179676 RepID=A0A336LUN1_CULSO